MSEKMKPLPCPNPECSTENPRVHFTILSGYEVYFIECQNDKCCHHGPPKHDEQEAITAWNALPRALVWTTEPPKEAGQYYWALYQNYQNLMVGAVQVVRIHGELHALIAGSKNQCPLSDFIQWAGPIPTPKKPTE